MSIFKAITISALAIPLMVFTIFVITSLVFLVSELITSGKYSNGWVGIVYAGATYGYFAVLLSSVPTIVLGLPASRIGKKYDVLNRGCVIGGAALLGGLFLGVASTMLFKATTIESFLWFALAGGLGGLVNGFVFWNYVKPNKAN